jgi:hypothetical protein
VLMLGPTLQCTVGQRSRVRVSTSTCVHGIALRMACRKILRGNGKPFHPYLLQVISTVCHSVKVQRCTSPFLILQPFAKCVLCSTVCCR